MSRDKKSKKSKKDKKSKKSKKHRRRYSSSESSSSDGLEIVGEQTCIDLLDDDDDPIEEVPVAPAPAAALQPVATETEATSSVIDKKSQPTPQETEGEPKAKRKRVVGVAKTKPVELDAEPEPVVATIGDDDETAVAEDQTTTAPEGQPGPAKPVAGPSTSEAGPSTDPDTAGPSTAPSEITRRKKKVYRPDELSSEDDDIQGVEEEEELDKFMSAIESGAHLKDKKLSKELGLDSAKLYAKGDAAYMKGKSKKRSSSKLTSNLQCMVSIDDEVTCRRDMALYGYNYEWRPEPKHPTRNPNHPEYRKDQRRRKK